MAEHNTLAPVFDDDAVAVALAANEYYVPYLSALLESISESASDARNYDIVVLGTDISDGSKSLLRDQVQRPNFSLRFFDMGDWSEQVAGLYLWGHFKVETYYRLALQDIMPEYSKILYLDCDMVVLEDVSVLYDTDLGDNLVAAVRDPDTAGLYNGFSPAKKPYMDNVLAMKDPYAYFQAGTVLFNLDAFRATYEVSELFSYAASYEWELLDQDVLNHFCEGRVKYVDMRWNVMMDMEGIRANQIIALAPDDLRTAYAIARKDPAIVHYAGPEKPWTHPDCDYAALFWSFCRKSPFYETALTRMCADMVSREVDSQVTRQIQEAVRAWEDECEARRRRTLAWKVKEALYKASLVFLPEGTSRRKLLHAVTHRRDGQIG